MAKTQGGQFNFQQIMDDFYGQEVGDDPGLNAQKQAFQGNLVQSGFDSMLAQQLSTHNSSLAQENMTHQADLEQRNQSSNMKNEFNYGINGSSV